MAGRVNNADHKAAVAGVIEASPQTAEVRSELRAIVESPAFKGSRRSQEFLRYIVENALDHHFDNLKERTLGVELFGRLPSYDTGEDAIVRVTACDVRKSRAAPSRPAWRSSCARRGSTRGPPIPAEAPRRGARSGSPMTVVT